ncbi:alpha/beta fold hydrolase [Streptomyces sp. B6B3]|uniref:alpha/beta fold hydrolase n=1 Tax=Streptomyces sp. B6B3 TaxID=3153570 RepID=UPI00325DB650
MDRTDRGAHEYVALTGTAPEDALSWVRRRSPRLYDAIVAGAYGDNAANADLGRAERALATVAMLAAQGGAEQQLATHARAALRGGYAPTELLAVAEHVASYAGIPRALDALTVLDDVLVREGADRPAVPHRARLTDHETLVAQRGTAGPPVLLLHALGLDWRMWEPVMPRLAAGRRVFAYDLRGHGRAAGAPAPFTLADAAADLVGVLDALGLARAHVVGLSYGGAVAQTAAVAYPERVASLALLATTDRPLESFEDRAAAAERDGMSAQVAPTLTRWFTAEALAEGGWGVRYARERIRCAVPADWAAAWRAFKGLDVHGRLADVGVPTLVLAGELDASTGPQLMRPIADRIPGAHYEELPGTPHMQTLERPDLVAAALDTFLPAEPGRAAA